MGKYRKFVPRNYKYIPRRTEKAPYLNPRQTLEMLLKLECSKTTAQCAYCKKKKPLNIIELFFDHGGKASLIKILNNLECEKCGCLKHKLI